MNIGTQVHCLHDRGMLVLQLFRGMLVCCRRTNVLTWFQPVDSYVCNPQCLGVDYIVFGFQHLGFIKDHQRLCFLSLDGLKGENSLARKDGVVGFFYFRNLRADCFESSSFWGTCWLHREICSPIQNCPTDQEHSDSQAAIATSHGNPGSSVGKGLRMGNGSIHLCTASFLKLLPISPLLSHSKWLHHWWVLLP